MRMKSTMLIFSLLGSISLIAVAAGDSVEISTDSRNITVEKGANFSLPCGIRGPGNYKVSWWFLDHHMQISINYTILTADLHYDIMQPLGRNNVYNLLLKMMNERMVGHYQCKVDGTLVSRTHTVNLAGYTQNRSSVQPVDFSGCCRSQGVTQDCLPACNPSKTPKNFSSDSCSTDLVKLLKCGTDGRNHVPCCRRRMVPDYCFDFCMNKTPGVFDNLHAECLMYAADISGCYMEGQALLPGPPAHLRVDNLNTNSVIIVWDPPPSDFNTANDVKGYRVFFKEDSGSHYRASELLRSTPYIWRNLNPFTKYQVYVVAIGIHGSSLPSYVAEFYGSAVTTPMAGNLNEDYTSTMECCQMRNVSAKCQQLMCTGVPVDMDSVPDTDIFGCFGEVHNALQCIAYERNHTQCCMRRNIPSRCHDICEGKVPRNFTQIDCLTVYMRRIVSCFEEGKGIIPGPPTDVQLNDVTETALTVQWRPPLSSRDPVKVYMVSYREEGQTEFIQIQTNRTSLLIEKLHPGTKYEVRVSSIGTQGSSLPSTSLVALTYYEYDSVLPFTTPTWSLPSSYQTFPECCASKGIKLSCQFLCNYTTDLSTVPGWQLLRCQSELPKFLSCGADGRNHTRCCSERGVMPKCLPFCAFSHKQGETFFFSFGHIDCIYQSASIVECMEEGLGLLPTEPARVTVVNKTAHSISIVWRSPSHIPDSGLTGYLLKYKVAGSPYDFKVKDVGIRTNYIIQNLDPGKRYAFQLLAHSKHGTSLPSETVESTTLEAKPDNPPLLPELNFTTPGNVSECCSSAGVSATCREACDGRSMVNINQCTSELQKLLTCSADKRDHKRCCRRFGVPTDCLGLCEGRLVTAHISSLMCLPFIPQILNCLREGYDTLPTPPERLTLENVLARSLTFSWNPPVKNGDDVWYNFYFSNQYTQTYNVKENVSSPLTLNNLSPSTFHTVFVVAVNKFGSSQPSSVMSVGTLEENRPTVQVYQRPPGYLREGSMVQLMCLAGGEPFPSIYWVTANDERSNATTLHFQSVNRRSTGHYTCIADNGLGRSSASVYLKVQYAPEAKAQEEMVYVQASKGLSAHLVCLFKGYPNISTINWEKDGMVLDPLSPESRMNAWAKDEESEGIVKAFLEINNVESSDAGVYNCHAWNPYGDDTATITVTTDMTATPPPFVPAPVVPNVTSCCMEQGVHPQCMVACTFDIDVSLVYALPDPLMCTMDLPKFAACAADGRDHSKCCRSKNVPDACLPVCSGVVSNLTVSLFVCVEYIADIIDCMEEGHGKIPSPPRMVRAEQNVDGYIQVRWQPPNINAEAVQHYNILYKNLDNGLSLNKTEPASKRSSLLNGISGPAKYTIQVTASNHHGSSGPSNQITLNTSEMMMSPPQRLRGTVISYVRVLLDWDVPYRYPGSVQKYKVYYRAHGWSNYMNFTTPGPNTTVYLETLQPGVKYEIYITALSKNKESGRSNVIAMETQVPPKVATHRARDKVIPLALGILFAVLVIAAAIGFFIFFVRRKPKTPKFKESVSFENPGYATTEARVHGIPNYGTEENPKRNGVAKITAIGGSVASSPSSKGSINDDSSDQGYSTLTPSEPLPYNGVTTANGYIPYDGYSNHSVDSNGISIEGTQDGVSPT